jgi:hypothetical protein
LIGIKENDHLLKNIESQLKIYRYVVDGHQGLPLAEDNRMGPSGFEPESQAPKARRITKLPHGPII